MTKITRRGHLKEDRLTWLAVRVYFSRFEADRKKADYIKVERFVFEISLKIVFHRMAILMDCVIQF